MSASSMGERRSLGVYGLGQQRSLADYAQLSGIDYASQTLQRDYQSSYTKPNP